MRYLSIAIMLVAAVSLTGCDRTRRALGLNKTVPDEFAIATPAPLAIPPDFNLRPPAPGSRLGPLRPDAEPGDPLYEAPIPDEPSRHFEGDIL